MNQTAVPATFLGRLRDSRDGVLAGFLVVTFVGFALAQPALLSPSSRRSLMLDVTLALVLALGQFMVVVTRNLDLSIGSVLGMAAMAGGVLGRAQPDASPVLIALMCVAVGLCAGLINGLVVSFLGLPSILFTLGMLTVYRGVVYLIGGGYQVNPNDVPESVVRLSTYTVGTSVPVVFLLSLAVFASVLYLTRQTRFGLRLFAVGSNPDAARLKGLPQNRVIVTAFALNGALVGFGGFLFMARYGFVQNLTGSGLELLAVAAVVIGGVSVFGGSGSAIGVALGVVMIQVLTTGFAVTGMSTFWRSAMYGFLILLAVSLDALSRQPRRGVAT